MTVKYGIQLNDNQIKLLSGVENAYMFHVKEGFRRIRELGWSENKARRIVRSVYGIVGLFEKHNPEPKKNNYIRGFYVPDKNYNPLCDALGGEGMFCSDFDEMDLPVLEKIYIRNRELREKYGNKWNPRFTDLEVARMVEIDREAAKRRLGRLVGILAETNVSKSIEIPFGERDDF